MKLINDTAPPIVNENGTNNTGWFSLNVLIKINSAPMKMSNLIMTPNNLLNSSEENDNHDHGVFVPVSSSFEPILMNPERSDRRTRFGYLTTKNIPINPR